MLRIYEETLKSMSLGRLDLWESYLENIEKMRGEYPISEVRLLFVGIAPPPPTSGRVLKLGAKDKNNISYFFNSKPRNERRGLRRNLQEILYSLCTENDAVAAELTELSNLAQGSDVKDFLEAFVEDGLYLEDIVSIPVDSKRAKELAERKDVLNLFLTRLKNVKKAVVLWMTSPDAVIDSIEDRIGKSNVRKTYFLYPKNPKRPSREKVESHVKDAIQKSILK